MWIAEIFSDSPFERAFSGVSDGWIAVPAVPGPAPRSDDTLVYDPASRRLLLVGGVGNDDTMFRELWEYGSGGWQKVH
jgi:hypothetical protein